MFIEKKRPSSLDRVVAFVFKYKYTYVEGNVVLCPFR